MQGWMAAHVPTALAPVFGTEHVPLPMGCAAASVLSAVHELARAWVITACVLSMVH